MDQRKETVESFLTDFYTHNELTLDPIYSSKQIVSSAVIGASRVFEFAGCVVMSRAIEGNPSPRVLQK